MGCARLKKGNGGGEKGEIVKNKNCKEKNSRRKWETEKDNNWVNRKRWEQEGRKCRRGDERTRERV